MRLRVMNLVVCHLPFRLAVIIPSRVQIPVEPREIAARNLKANPVTRREIVAGRLKINRQLVHAARFH